MSVTLYHAPPSFYSQIARLVLAEKGVSYRRRLVVPGPPFFESYAPWYMRWNPNGTIPTLLHDAHAVPDSRAILGYVDATFPGPPLSPSDPETAARMEALLEALYRISIRELSYGSDRLAKLGARLNEQRARALRRLADHNPELHSVYETKRRDITTFDANASDPAKVDAQRANLAAVLDDLDRAVATAPFVAGPSYSLADVVATVTVARARMLGHDPFASRPALAAWFERMVARPSFAAADIWDRFKPIKIVGMVAWKLAPLLLGLIALAAVLGLLFFAVCSGHASRWPTP